MGLEQPRDPGHRVRLPLQVARRARHLFPTKRQRRRPLARPEVDDELRVALLVGQRVAQRRLDRRRVPTREPRRGAQRVGHGRVFLALGERQRLARPRQPHQRLLDPLGLLAQRRLVEVAQRVPLGQRRALLLAIADLPRQVRQRAQEVKVGQHPRVPLDHLARRGQRLPRAVQRAQRLQPVGVQGDREVPPLGQPRANLGHHPLDPPQRLVRPLPLLQLMAGDNMLTPNMVEDVRRLGRGALAKGQLRLAATDPPHRLIDEGDRLGADRVQRGMPREKLVDHPHRLVQRPRLAQRADLGQHLRPRRRRALPPARPRAQRDQHHPHPEPSSPCHRSFLRPAATTPYVPPLS